MTIRTTTKLPRLSPLKNKAKSKPKNNNSLAIMLNHDSPASALERSYIEEYLHDRGYCWRDLEHLPLEEAKALMRTASRYASLKLAEVEARCKFRHEIEYPG